MQPQGTPANAFPAQPMQPSSGFMQGREALLAPSLPVPHSPPPPFSNAASAAPPPQLPLTSLPRQSVVMDRRRSNQGISVACCNRTSTACLIYLGAIFVITCVTVALQGTFASPIFFILGAMGPSLFFVLFYCQQNKEQAFREQCLYVGLEMLIWLFMLLCFLSETGIDGWIKFITESLVGGEPEYKGFFWAVLLGSALRAFVRAAFLEEFVKWICVRRLLWKNFVLDPRALVVYSVASAAAFAAWENIVNFGISGGSKKMTVEQISGTTFVRALCSIPLHCVTGVFIGSGLARKKFFQEPWAEVTGFVSAVLIHGFYDFFLMFQAGLAEYVVTMEWDGKNPWVDYRMALRYLYLMGRVTPVTPLVITTALPWIFARREVTRLSSFPLINCRALRDARQTETPDCLCESLCPRVDPRFPFSARRGCTSVHTIVAKQPENWYTEILPWLKSGAVTQQGVETPLTAGGSLQGGGEVASLPNGASNSSGSPTGGGTYKTAPGPTLPGGSSSSQTGATSNPNPTTVVEPLEEP